MKDIKAMVEEPREIALYSSMTTSNSYLVLGVYYVDYDEHYQPLPKGQRREQPKDGYVRVSEPMKVSFTAIDTDTLVRNAVESLNEQERKTIDELNQKLAEIREKRSQLLALTHEVKCERCESFEEVHGPQCPEHPDYDPTPWCTACGAQRQADCKCGPIARNE